MMPVFLLASALALSAASPAQPASRSAALRQAAGCVVEGDRQASADLARAIPGSAEEWEVQGRLTPLVRRCLAGAGIIDPTGTQAPLAGLVAERLYLGSVNQYQSRPATAPAPATAGAPTLAQATSLRTQGWTAQAAFAECVVAAAPNEVDRLVRTDAGSIPEAEAIQSLATTSTQCLNQGRQLAMGRARLRAELARALYRQVAGVLVPLPVPGQPHAETATPGIGTPGTTLSQIVQLRYDSTLAPGRDRLEVLQRALVQRDRQTAEALAASPRNMERVEERATFLSGTGRDEEALALLAPYSNDFAATIMAGGTELVNDVPYLLLRLGRKDEAVAAMARLARLPPAQIPTVLNAGFNAKINYFGILVDAGRYQEALDEIRTFRTRDPLRDSVNNYGQAWILASSICALAGLDRLAEARPQIDRLRGLRNTNPRALSQALLCAGDTDAAAAELVRRLGDHDPSLAILALQNFETGAGPPDPLYRRLMTLRERPDVRAALDRVGRVLAIPLPQAFWSYY
jgi:tetratricopeptide (TPR) repeat protein